MHSLNYCQYLPIWVNIILSVKYKCYTMLLYNVYYNINKAKKTIIDHGSLIMNHEFEFLIRLWL